MKRKRYKRIFEIENNIKEDSFQWLNLFMLTSKVEKPNQNIINFLKNYPQKINTIYRGMYLMRDRVSKEKHEELNNLKIGDKIPNYLIRPSGISSYTKKLSLAKKYSKDGHMNIIIEAKPNKDSIILDLETFAKQLKKENETYFDEEDLKYMLRDKEVIILEPIEATLIEKSGKL
jgi:hypothetical protein